MRRRAANVVGDTSALNSGSSAYSRMGITHMSILYWRMRPGRMLSMPHLEPCLLAIGLLAKGTEGAVLGGQAGGGQTDRARNAAVSAASRSGVGMAGN